MLNNTISIIKSKFSPTGVISLIFPIAYSGIVLIVLYLKVDWQQGDYKDRSGGNDSTQWNSAQLCCHSR